MEIKKVKKLKQKVTVYIDETKLDILHSTCDEFNLYEGKEIDLKLADKIKEYNRLEEFFVKCVQKLNRYEVSPNKLSEFLYKKGAKKDEINKVLERLSNNMFVDEERMFNDILSYADSRHYGYNKIISLANNKKLSNKVISKYRYDYDREYKEAELKLELLVKKYKNKVNHATLKKNCLEGLIRNGFSEHISLEILNKINNEDNTNELNMLKLDYSKCIKRYSKKLNGSKLNKKVIEYLLSKGYRYNDIKTIKELENYEVS